MYSSSSKSLISFASEVYILSKVRNAAPNFLVEFDAELAEEFFRLLEKKKIHPDDFFDSVARNFVREEKLVQMRVSLQKGYEDMATLNLHLATEAFYAESEATYTVERMVSGG